MKNSEQIIRYAACYRFSPKDWEKVYDFFRSNNPRGRIFKAKEDRPTSTYDEFMKWVESDFGPGKIVSYHKTIGVVGDPVPGQLHLFAYLDFNGNLIQKNSLEEALEVSDIAKIKLATPEQRETFLGKMHEAKVRYSIRHGRLEKVCTPKKYFYYVIDSIDDSLPAVGMYSESDGAMHHFVALLEKGKVSFDCWREAKCTVLRPAQISDIKRLHDAAMKAGRAFNERTHSFVKVTNLHKNNVYWYLNESFDILKDVDNGESKHTARYRAGNYFLDQTSALLFMGKVVELAKINRREISKSPS